IMDPYVPPEGDARLSSLSKDGVKQQVQKLRQTAASQLAYWRKSRNFFRSLFFVLSSLGFSLCSFNKQKLHSLVTERCYPRLIPFNPMGRGTSHYLSSPPNPSWDGFFGIFSQTLAIYDRFGRLMCGGEEIPKDVLEYVVFERYLVNPFGTWRMHGKIVPEWAPPKDPIVKTVMIPGPALDPSQEHE
ncbi:RM45 protein, partial [Sterrhoptilus dennistouni]|nr:RM45 protein [Sterrhoptilus dennistouni]